MRAERSNLIRIEIATSPPEADPRNDRTMLKEKISEDLKLAMKLGDAEKVSTLRFLISALRNAEIDLRPQGKELNDDVVLSVLSKQVKQRRESITAYEQGGRSDLAQKEKEELVILQAYLPEQMGEEEIRGMVKRALEQSGSREMGLVMKTVMPMVKGKADGATVRKIVEEELAS